MPVRTSPYARALPWLAGAVGLVGMILAVTLFRNSGSVEQRPLEAQPLASAAGLEVEPRFSPDGARVAYVWNGPREDNFDIWVRPASGGAPIRLTTDPAHDYSPAWSPDGKSIAFLRLVSAQRAAVMVLPVTSGAERKLGETYSRSWPHWHFPGPFLAWSPDGRWLVVAAREGDTGPDRLARLSLETGAWTVLTRPEPSQWGDMGPSCSPDGRSIAFARALGWGVADLHVQALTPDFLPDGPPRRIETGAAWNASPSWLPGGRELVFSTGTVELPHLALVPARGGAVSRLGAGFDSAWYPSAAPAPGNAGLRMAFTRHFEVVNIWRQPLAGTARPERLIASSRRDLTPEYSPDGRRVAFTSDRSGAEEIWVAGADGGEPRQWTTFGGAHVGGPHWSPDSRRIAFDAEVNRRFRIYTIDGPGDAPRMVLESKGAMWHPAWSRDGQWLYFAADWNGQGRIWKVPAVGGPSVQVTLHPAGTPDLSADGRFLYHIGSGENHLWRVPLPLGKPELLIEWVGEFALGPTGVFYTRFRPGTGLGEPSVYFRSYDGGPDRKVATAGGLLRPGLAVSPDGSSLLFTQVAYDVSDVMLATQ